MRRCWRWRAAFPTSATAEAAGALRHWRRRRRAGSHHRLRACALRDTLSRIDAGHADAFDRVSRAGCSAPFTAIKVTGALFHTQGGLDVDAQMRVLRSDGLPMPNLLAAGGAARGVSGNAVWGYLSGNGLLSAVAGGYLAARTASHLLQRRAG